MKCCMKWGWLLGWGCLCRLRTAPHPVAGQIASDCYASCTSVGWHRPPLVMLLVVCLQSLFQVLNFVRQTWHSGPGA